MHPSSSQNTDFIAPPPDLFTPMLRVAIAIYGCETLAAGTEFDGIKVGRVWQTQTV